MVATELKLGVYDKLGVKRIINGWGTITRVGGTLMPPEVVEAMAEAARSFVDMDELYVKAGEVVAKHTHAEAGLVTTGCAASLMLGTAAAIAGMDPSKHHQLPDTTGLKNEVVIHRSHRNGYDHSFRATTPSERPERSSSRSATPTTPRRGSSRRRSGRTRRRSPT
jgi:D-glucosaminate-6-phosphate ammonia-lyase